MLNTIDLSQADFSPMRSSFVNHDCPSLLSTVIVSLLRSICLPALRSTVIIRFITTMADSDFRKFVFAALCLALVPQIPCSCGKFPDLLCSVTYLCKLADACTPGGWFPLAYRQCGLRKPVACQLNHLSASTIASISGVSRSPFGFGSDTSLSTLHLPGYPGRRKTRYPVALAAPSGAGLSPAR
ncbi:hypothetical protein SME10J_40980 [Serratia marcescens]|nr:hypothetical protein SME10J_40980 [Serratia marcescens]